MEGEDQILSYAELLRQLDAEEHGGKDPLKDEQSSSGKSTRSSVDSKSQSRSSSLSSQDSSAARAALAKEELEKNAAAAQQAAKDRASAAREKGAGAPIFFITESGDGSVPHEMVWDETLRYCHTSVQLDSSGTKSFQILVNGDSRKRVHPDRTGASVHSDFIMQGPDSDTENSWTIGAHELDEGVPGAWYDVRAHVNASDKVVNVDWIKLRADDPKPSQGYWIVGTWDEWTPHEMNWDPDHQCFHFVVELGKSGQESFQILVNCDQRKRLYPDPGYECFPSGHEVSGPYNIPGHHWTIGKHAFDKGQEGACYKVRLRLRPTGRAGDIDWRHLGTRKYSDASRCGVKFPARPTSTTSKDARVTPKNLASALHRSFEKVTGKVCQASSSPPAAQAAVEKNPEEAMRHYSQRVAKSHGEIAPAEVATCVADDADAAPSPQVRAELLAAASFAGGIHKDEDEAVRGALRKCFETAEDSDGEELYLCSHCGLPVGDYGYNRVRDTAAGEAPLVHGECAAQLLVRDLREKEEQRVQEEAAVKQKRRSEYNIGWVPSRVPRRAGPPGTVSALAAADPAAPCCLALQESGQPGSGQHLSVRVANTAEPAAAVNLAYLALALQVRLRDGREPWFSLDPAGADGGEDAAKETKQVKRFIPDWLAGTSAGEVLFQADYYLKELSMGEYEQPVLGMRSCLDNVKHESDGSDRATQAQNEAGWTAREWFVVRDAAVHLSRDGVLVPRVSMGVEAREQVAREDGRLEDTAMTRPDHPLVKYAEAFTENFDLIAERRSVIYHLRELAKAAALSKFLLEACIGLDGSWFSMPDEEMAPCIKEIPQLWNEHVCSQIRVRDGELLDGGNPETGAKVYGLYGGVEIGLSRMRVFDRGTAAVLKGHLAAVAAKVPKGVDLALDRFDLSETKGEWDACLSSHGAPLALGSAFWASLNSGSKSVLQDADRALFEAVFNPRLSDRREEGDFFVPPDTSSDYMGKLQDLIGAEAQLRRQRIEHFCSVSFTVDDAGALFPSSWTSRVRLDRQRNVTTQEGRLEARPDYKADRESLNEVLRFASPAFDKCTEDGLRFRIYRVGSLEVRTVQEQNEEAETIGAVFSKRLPTAALGTQEDAAALGDQEIAKVTQYVEATRCANVEGQHLSRQYYVVLETKQGALILTEKHKDGSTTWEVNPSDLADRSSMAKVVYTADCSSSSSPVTVGAIRSWSAKYRTSHSAWTVADRKRYAHNVLLQAAGTRRMLNFQTGGGQWQQWWTADWGRQQLSGGAPRAPEADQKGSQPASVATEAEARFTCGQCSKPSSGPAADGKLYCDDCWWAWEEECWSGR